MRKRETERLEIKRLRDCCLSVSDKGEEAMRSQRIFTVLPMLLLLVMGLIACQPQTVVETRVVEVMATRVVEYKN